MSEHTFIVHKTTRYSTYGELTSQTKYIWFVFHGYGQLAKFFIRKFNSLNEAEHFIVAPEGLHRFYLQGHNGRVGASWMTKEARLDDIKDYINFSDQLFTHIMDQVGGEVKVNILGFSQGAATVSRWISQSKIDLKIDNFILWASVFPPDIDFEINKVRLNNANVILVIGNEDEFVSADMVQQHTSILGHNQIKHTVVEFEGKHDITKEGLEKLIELI